MEASTSPAIRSWRTSLLTLRDEVQNSPSATTVIHLLNTLIFTQSQTLIAASPNLPVHETTSDAMFFVELGRTISSSKGDEDVIHALVQLSNLIQNLSHLISFKMTSSTWSLVLHTFGGMVEIFLGGAPIKRDPSGNVAVIETTKQCLETVRSLVDVNQRTIMLSDNVQLLDFLLKTDSFSQNILSSFFVSGIHGCPLESRKKILKKNSLWEIQTTVFTMINDVFSRVGLPYNPNIGNQQLML